MLVLGVDPGVATTGFGLVNETDQGNLMNIQYGVITTSAGEPLERRLLNLYLQINQLITQHHPDCCSVEKLFFQKNVTTAMSVGQARGIVLLAAASASMPVYEYTPLEVKQAVSGYGGADKKQVQTMVQVILQLPDLPRPDDAADALAVAICHLNHKFIHQ
jgi:crossover junction endodeoxyribonuclease RuvC